MGEWVLLAALQRTEAGALHAISDRPRETSMGSYPWYIAVCQASEGTATSQVKTQETTVISDEEILRLRRGLLGFVGGCRCRRVNI
jgi:hypothetical protein